MSSLSRTLNKYGLWIFYVAFVATAMVTHSGEPMFVSEGPYAAGKPVLWAILVAFSAYSWRIGQQEDFFNSLRRLWPILWSRQIGLDLYIGLLVPLFLIYLHTGSWLVLLLWFVPIFIFANMATLLFLALNYDSLVAGFI